MSFKVRRDLVDRLTREAARETLAEGKTISRSEIVIRLLEEALAARKRRK